MDFRGPRNLMLFVGGKFGGHLTAIYPPRWSGDLGKFLCISRVGVALSEVCGSGRKGG